MPPTATKPVGTGGRKRTHRPAKFLKINGASVSLSLSSPLISVRSVVPLYPGPLARRRTPPTRARRSRGFCTPRAGLTTSVITLTIGV